MIVTGTTFTDGLQLLEGVWRCSGYRTVRLIGV